VIARSDEDIARFIDDLKTQPGSDINLSGGARLAQSILRLGLVDEYHFFVHPVVSAGATWFGQIEDERGMDLIGATVYENGVVAAYYEPRNTSDTPRPDRFSDLLS
jgi:dihydrofolate reductase